MDVIEQNDRILLLQFPGLGTHTAIGRPPAGDNTPIALAARKALTAVATYDEARIAAQRTSHLTPAGLEAHLAPLRAAAQKAVETAAADFAEGMAYNAREREKLFAIPPGDAATDIGYQQRVHAMTRGPQRDALFSSLPEPVLMALARDAIPTPEGDAARGILRERVAREQKARLTTLDDHAQETEWAQSLVGALQSVLAKSAPVAPRAPRRF